MNFIKTPPDQPKELSLTVAILPYNITILKRTPSIQVQNHARLI
jgi:hypothetical protein